MYFVDYPGSVIKDVNIKSDGNTGLVLELENTMLPQEKVQSFAFSLTKVLRDEEEEDVTNYLDTRMCLSRTNKQVIGSDGACVSYVFRKVKIGTWAKTSLREEASFVLKCVIQTSQGRSLEVKSPLFEIYSHQSQLPQRRERKSDKKPVLKRTRTPPSAVVMKSLDPVPFVEDDVFGLVSLSDAALKVAFSSSEEDAPLDSAQKKLRLIERADDLRKRITSLEYEEKMIREQVEQMAAEAPSTPELIKVEAGTA